MLWEGLHGTGKKAHQIFVIHTTVMDITDSEVAKSRPVNLLRNTERWLCFKQLCRQRENQSL